MKLNLYILKKTLLFHLMKITKTSFVINFPLLFFYLFSGFAKNFCPQSKFSYFLPYFRAPFYVRASMFSAPLLFFTLRISLGCCGRYEPAELISLIFSCFVVVLWIFTGHWILLDGNSIFNLQNY